MRGRDDRRLLQAFFSVRSERQLMELYTVEDARTLMRAAGLTEFHSPLLSALHPLHHLSLACVGRKPAPAPFENLTIATGD